MRLDGVLKPLKESAEFKSILDFINKGQFPGALFGISESAKSFVLEAIYENTEKTFLILTNSDVEARSIYEDLSLYNIDTYYFPTRDVVFYNAYAVSGDIRWERLKVIKRMMEPGRKVIVASIDSLAVNYAPKEMFKKYMFKLSVGDSVNIDEIGKKLIECGYERCDLVQNKGQYSIRGGIVDIFPPYSANPFRIELFGDEIDSIRNFNPDTQRSLEKVNEFEIFPAKEIILTRTNIERAISRMKNELEVSSLKFKAQDNMKTCEKINNTINKDIESLDERWSFENMESFLPYFYEKTSTLLDYVGDSYVFIDDIQRCEGKLDSTYYEFEEDYKTFLEMGDILPGQNNILLNRHDIGSLLEKNKVVSISALPKTYDILKPQSIVSFTEITQGTYHGQFKFLLDDIKEKKSKDYRILILSGTRPRGERLVKTLEENGIESTYSDSFKDIKPGEVKVTFGSQIRGFDFPDIKLSVISDIEVFGEYKKKKAKASKRGIDKIKSFTELKVGDYVVHVNHGIGVYKGIKQLEVEGHKKDYLELAYEGGDKLYVPAEQLDLIQKYIGSEGKAPKITKLGGSEWTKLKNKVKKSIMDIAEDLLKLYAVRSTMKGFRYSKDTIWQKQFEDEFIYEETPDQLTAIEDIKSDMESDKSMDRLLCGDVGYGKTEVAVRAAFKAVMDGKQVAFLVPTTILAEQHYNNFIKRFSDFPVKVDMISRFRTSAQQKATIKKVKEGNVDILIGTHRILQKDVMFKDLGLLIIDEEQRFGVTHKEKIKNLKKNVDVLTLTATPIPRTLHLSLTGVRDISVIETPPEERYPIQTYVVEFNEQLIKDAIQREINRNGQVYFVFNRVEKIHEMAAYISHLVPSAQVAVAHGQMSERELEKIMMGFMNNESNVLVCTTIIETGMDIPNVNTIIIYDADKFGLSQLYQLRGRVGRSNKIAYSYLTYRKEKVLSEVAEKRLKAIKEFTELGSGFKIALKDLEIRGAGNMMGSAQHGHMEAIGYDLYCKMLEDMIKLMKGDISKEPVETSVEIKIDAYIPASYIQSETQKIEIYKKIAAISSKEELMDTTEEIEDRFSDIPQCVYNLMNISYIRALGREIGITQVKENGNEVDIVFESSDRMKKEAIMDILKKYNKVLKIKMGKDPVLYYNLKDVRKEKALQDIIKIFEDMVNIQKKALSVCTK